MKRWKFLLDIYLRNADVNKYPSNRNVRDLLNMKQGTFITVYDDML